ncbi:MAG: class I SAM-dependent methyltransferase [Polyangiaceae bacterium]|nr:class I SAM-dependent methyltransferase [Polyangiaceae bacterium]
MESFEQFDEAYYERFYLNPETRVVSPAEHAQLAQFVFAFAKYNGIEVSSVLDIGAGIGLWKNWIEKNAKKAKYTGTEVSKVMCEQHGYQERDIARWRDRDSYDLIICQGVFQYLPDPDLAPAIANLAAMSKGLLYLEATTRLDLRERTDKEKTDQNIHIRNGSYYRGIMQKYFHQVGAGLWWTRELPLPFFELEMAGTGK